MKACLSRSIHMPPGSADSDRICAPQTEIADRRRNTVMIIVHHLNESRSQRILWLLEELAIPYEIRSYLRDPYTNQAPLTLRDVHPLGRSPIITDEKFVIAESGAIIDYLIRRHGRGQMQ